jgi:predicted S18 family serine protease
MLLIMASLLAISQHGSIAPVAAAGRLAAGSDSLRLPMQQNNNAFVSIDQTINHLPNQTIIGRQQHQQVNIPSSNGSGLSSLSAPTSQSIPFLTVVADRATGTVFPGSGQVLKLMIDVREGRGDILINTNIFAGEMWQSSARMAASVAQSLTHIDLSSKDVIFTIKSTNSTVSEELLRKFGGVVEGPSAGAAMTALLISELEGKAVNNYTAMTGTINSDGTIGRVGGVIEKAIAAGKYGTKVMLVPAGQGYYPEMFCKSGDSPFLSNTLVKSKSCRLDEKPLSDIMEMRYGMKVIEVHDMQSALRYFQSNSLNKQEVANLR